MGSLQCTHEVETVHVLLELWQYIIPAASLQHVQLYALLMMLGTRAITGGLDPKKKLQLAETMTASTVWSYIMLATVCFRPKDQLPDGVNAVQYAGRNSFLPTDTATAAGDAGGVREEGRGPEQPQEQFRDFTVVDVLTLVLQF